MRLVQGCFPFWRRPFLVSIPRRCLVENQAFKRFQYQKEVIVVTGMKIIRLLTWLGIALLQLIMTQLVTFLLSLLVPGMENFPQTHSVLFVVILGVTFSTGVFLAGWLALKLRWLAVKPKYPARLVATLIGACLPLIVALILYHSLEPGNPFFFISMLTSVLGFHVPGWIVRKWTVIAGKSARLARTDAMMGIVMAITPQKHNQNGRGF